MNEIFHRTSIRNYLDRQIEQEKVEQLLRAAMTAPSAGNQQPWEYYVVTNSQFALVNILDNCFTYFLLWFSKCHSQFHI